MKILLVIPTFYPSLTYGGPIISSYNLCKELIKNKISLTVITTNQNGKKRLNYKPNIKHNINGIEVIYFNNSKILSKIYYSYEMKKFIDKNITKYDVVHLHSIFTWPIYYTFKKAYANNIPTILSPRGMLVADLIKDKNRIIKNLILYIFYKNIISKCSQLLLTSNLELDEIIKLKYKNNYKIIPNGINYNNDNFEYISKSSEKFLYNLDNNNKTIVAFIGRITPKKNIEKKFELLTLFTNVELLLIGEHEPAYFNKLTRIVDKNKLENRVHFLGNIHGSYKKLLYEKCDYTILLSKQENFANSVLESMHFGVPVILSKNIGINEYLNIHPSVFIFENLFDLSRDNKFKNLKIETILTKSFTNSKEYKKMQTNCINLSQNFEWKNIINKYIENYSKVKSKYFI